MAPKCITKGYKSNVKKGIPYRNVLVCVCVCLYHFVSFCSLGALTAQHVVVGVVSDGVDVGRDLGAAFALVGSHHWWRVDRQPLVRVHRHAEEP